MAVFLESLLPWMNFAEVGGAVAPAHERGHYEMDSDEYDDDDEDDDDDDDDGSGEEEATAGTGRGRRAGRR